jgi:hypothetical protein
MSLRLIFRITALDSLLSHKGLTASSALFCEKFSRKSIANTYVDKFKNKAVLFSNGTALILLRKF